MFADVVIILLIVILAVIIDIVINGIDILFVVVVVVVNIVVFVVVVVVVVIVFIIVVIVIVVITRSNFSVPTSICFTHAVYVVHTFLNTSEKREISTQRTIGRQLSISFLLIWILRL